MSDNWQKLLIEWRLTSSKKWRIRAFSSTNWCVKHKSILSINDINVGRWTTGRMRSGAQMRKIRETASSRASNRNVSTGASEEGGSTEGRPKKEIIEAESIQAWLGFGERWAWWSAMAKGKELSVELGKVCSGEGEKDTRMRRRSVSRGKRNKMRNCGFWMRW